MQTREVSRERVEELLRDAHSPVPSNRRTLARLELIGIKITATREALIMSPRGYLNEPPMCGPSALVVRVVGPVCEVRETS